jgi:hypothetical protein
MICSNPKHPRSMQFRFGGRSARARRVHTTLAVTPTSEIPMEIKFRHDVDNVLKEAKKQNKPVLLDFSAAPM